MSNKLIICYNIFGDVMKILIISHIADIDGMGSIVLANQVFDKFDKILIEPRELDSVIDNLISNNTYDKIFICDLAMEEKTGLKILNSNLKDIVRQFDHHATNNFNFYFAIVEEYRGTFMPCGTSLFYEFLNKEYNFKNNASDIFVEATRSYDTYNFKKDGNIYAKALCNLFFHYDIDKYIDIFSERLKESPNEFYLNEEEVNISNKYLNEEIDYINLCDNNLIFTTIDNASVAISISDRFRSSVGNTLSEKYKDKVDFVLVVNFDRKSFSLRTVKDFNVGIFAQKYNGGGHDKAAGIPFNDISLDMLYNIIKKEDIESLRIR